MALTEVNFSAREMEVLALAWQCMDQQPKIDMQKLARLAGYTPASASVTFGKIKTKLRQLGDSLSANDAGGNGDPTTPKKAAKPRKPKTPNSKRKGAVVAMGDDDDEASPTKKSKSKKGVPDDDTDGLEDDEIKLEMKNEFGIKAEPFGLD